MKLTIDATLLAEAVQHASHTIVGRRSDNPEGRNLELEAVGSVLQVSSVGPEMSTTVQVPATVEEQGVVWVPARRLVPFVEAQGSGSVELFQSRGRLHLLCGGVGMVCAITTDMTDPPSHVDVTDWQAGLDAELLADGLSRTLHAADRTGAGILSGVLLMVEEEQLTLAAADGVRVAEAVIPLQERAALSLRAVLPRDAAQELVSLARFASGSVLLHLDTRLSALLSGTGVASFRAALWAQPELYPPYQKVFEQPVGGTVCAAAQALATQVKMLAATTAVAGRPDTLRLSLTDDALLLSASDGESTSVQARLPALTTGQGRVGLSGALLAQALAVFGRRDVTLALGAESTPVVISSPSLPGVRQALMPVFVNWEERVT